jgi:uncharacterized cupredoxin-like copper-binding protein
MPRSPSGRRSLRAAIAVIVTAALVGGFALAGIAAGDHGSSAAKARTTTLRLKASSTKLRFNVKTLRARRGRVTVIMTNPSSGNLPHAVAVEGKGVDKDGRTVRPGGVSRVTVNLRKTGRYEFYCPVDGHKRAGMKGVLIIRR